MRTSRSRRHRLPDRRYEFRFKKGQLLETTEDRSAYWSGSSVFGQSPPPDTERPPHTIYIDDNGYLDPTSESLVRQEHRDFLVVLTCRMPPESREASGARTHEDWEAILRKSGMPAELRPSTPFSGGIGANELEQLHANQRTRSFEVQTARHRRDGPLRLQSMPPSEYRRCLIARLSLFFGRSRNDPLIRRMTDRLVLPRGWRSWTLDPELKLLRDACLADDQLHRLVIILEGYSEWRVKIARSKIDARNSRGFSFQNRFGMFRFEFPSPEGRHSAYVKELTAVIRAIVHSDYYIARGRWFDKAWLAAVVWLGQDYLKTPSYRNGGARLTQDDVARRFKISRRQLTHALKKVRAAGARNGILVPPNVLPEPS